MGSSTTLLVDGYEILDSGSYVLPEIMTLFREGDRAFRRRTSSKRRPRSWKRGAPPLGKGRGSAFDHAYVAPAWVIRDRLDLMGFTVDAARAAFTEGIARAVDELREWRSSDSDFSDTERLELLERLTFEEWLHGLREVKKRGLAPWQRWQRENARGRGSTLLSYILSEADFGEHLLGFPASDVRYLLSAALRICSPEALVVQDISDVIDAGYYDAEATVAADAVEALIRSYPFNARVIVLTEGSSDRYALEGALRVLYPHLTDYYAFMDFAAMAVPGGAPQLVASVKAFAGAGITNRVVAMFDNDSAARDALRALDRLPLPKNFRVLRYPDVPSASKWPTIGPTGDVSLNVNGLAGSIELYFGADVLRRPDGSLTPVQWKGFIPGVGQYQGEILDKPELQARFRQKVQLATSSPGRVGELDWAGMRAILDTLRNAFASGEPESERSRA